MVKLSESSVFEPEITRTETNDILLGGNEVNHPNLPNKQLANRTRWLKTQVDNLLTRIGNLVIGKDVQAWDADLDGLSILNSTGLVRRTDANRYSTVPNWVDNSICPGHLGLVRGAPHAPVNIASAKMIYFTPDGGNRISLLDGSGEWVLHPFQEISLSLAGLPGQRNHDAFIFVNVQGVLQLEAVAWANDFNRQIPLGIRDGVFVKNGEDAKRYVGTFRTSAVGEVADNPANRLVYSHCRTRRRHPAMNFSITAYTYSLSTPRPSSGGLEHARARFVVGLAGNVRHHCQLTADGNLQARGRINNSSTDLSVDLVIRRAGGNTSSFTDSFSIFVSPGFHSASLWESSESSGNVTYVRNTITFD